jgi:protein-S-isoprenylcysteine O-methyltransferase Ste14
VSGLELKIPPPIVALLAGTLMWALGRWLPGASFGPVPWALVLALAVFGIAIGVSGFIGFRAKGTTIDPHKPDRATALVTGGVYRVTRNPMYLGLSLVLLAWALRLGAATAFVGPPLFLAWIRRFQVGPEERVLTALFGTEYQAYCARVRRWL